jgi:hypothetical protein
MDAALTNHLSSARPAMLLLARVVQRAGWHGVAGIALIVAAGIVLWSGSQRHRVETQAPSSSGGTAITPPAVAQAAVRLPPQTDVPLLLSRMERSAMASGLGWPSADYRVTAATNEAPVSLDVRVALQGPYVAVRRFVTALLLDHPSLTLREFSVTRANAEAPQVEARLAIVVYLATEEPRR